MTSATWTKMPARGPDYRRSRRRGFTLVELLLVVVIVGVLVAASMPALVSSIRWQRLRAAARTLTTATRYARSMAVLKQVDVEVAFNLETGLVELRAPGAALPGFSRVIAGVNLESVAPAGGEPATEGTVVITFRRNGTCRPFKAVLRDAHGNVINLEVDALAGVTSASTE